MKTKNRPMSFSALKKRRAEEGRHVRNKLIAITVVVTFMIKILASSQLYRLPNNSTVEYNTTGCCSSSLIILFHEIMLTVGNLQFLYHSVQPRDKFLRCCNSNQET